MNHDPVLDEILTDPQVCALLGVCTRTLARWRKRRHRPLPAFQPSGRRVFYVKCDVIDWLRSHATRPTVDSPRALKRPRREAIK